jgi:pyruvate/2-oxoglutarate dehydrogenase complex dihydrolipoamide dehydrogenase (E3) component
VRVGEREFAAERIFVNTGTRSLIPAIDGLDRVDYLTSGSILGVTELPESLVVVGGGYVGSEFAQMFARFGSRVTVVQRSDRLLPGEEPELSEVIQRAFEREGIKLLTRAEAVGVAETNGKKVVTVRTGDGERTVEGSQLLVAAGRQPNSDGLGLEAADVELDAAGFVKADERLRTTRPGIWALGDVIGPPMFTHSARDDAQVAYRNVFKGQDDASVAGRVVPHAVFTDPEVASAGLTEHEAEAAGHDVSVGLQEFSGVGKALVIGETDGFIKIVADRRTGEILGCHIVGPDAANLIHEVVVAITAGAPARTIAEAIHIHPTLAEGVNAAAGGVHRPSVG